jgi:hypothetical protein
MRRPVLVLILPAATLVGLMAFTGCGSGTSSGSATTGTDSGSDATTDTDARSSSGGSDGGTDSGSGDGASLHDGATSDGGAGDAGGPDACSQTSNCFAAPGACCFPDPTYHNVGVPPSETLTPSGSITVTTPGTTVKNLDVSGSITISASDTTVQYVRLTVTAGGSGTTGISIDDGVTGTIIEDTTVVGSGMTNSPESAIWNHYSEPLTLTRVYLYDFADPLEGPATITDSYIDSNGTYGSGSNVAHIEDVYVSDGTVTVSHSVLLNPSGQTATVFMDTSGSGAAIAGDDHLTITGSLLAGGGWTLYPSAKSTTVGTATMNISNNRFARCLSAGVFDGSGTTCKDGPDSHGYYPNSGYYGVAADDYCPPTSGQTWTGNVWDDDETAIACP